MALALDTTYSNAYRADNLGEVKPKILIGGKTEKFVPNVNMSFGLESSKEQYFLNINRASVTVDNETSSLASEKLALTIGNETDIWHIDENGRLEWDIEFKEKPSTNVFSWDLQYSEGIEFHYQPALTQEEIDSGHERPDNVVGSYAVICNKSGHYKDVDGKTIVNYRAGNLMHIYRPLCIDAKGNKEWADLLIEKGTLTITIPQKYLDTAKYPVTLDPNFGYDTAGASYFYVTVNVLYGPLTGAVGSGGTGNSISAYFSNGGDGRNFKGVLIDHSDSDVIETNGVGNETNIPSGTAWRTSAFGTSPTITNGTTYYPFVIMNNAALKLYYNTVTSEGLYDGSNSYETPANPGALSSDNGKYSVYCTYTETGGASIPRSNAFSRPFRQAFGRGGL